jgi:type IV pilus assembly protein PilE
MQKRRGFTLIELMVAIAIIALLVTIAYPSYLGYLKKGRRAAAQTFMSEVANKQSQYLLDNRNYAVNISDLSTSNALGVVTPSDVSPYYTVKVDPAAVTSPPTFTITATPKGDQVSDGALTLDHTGAKTRNGQSGW